MVSVIGWAFCHPGVCTGPRILEFLFGARCAMGGWAVTACAAMKKNTAVAGGISECPERKERRKRNWAL